MIDRELHTAFMNECKLAGYPIKVIRNDTVEWFDKSPSEKDLQALKKKASKTISTQEKKKDVRREISQQAGDTSTLLGIQSDVMGLLLIHMLADIVTSKGASANAAQKARIAIMQEISGDVDIVKLADETFKKIKAGESTLTASLKGVQNVINDALTSSTKVVKILKKAAEK